MLPLELIIKISTDLPLEDIVSLSLTCRKFYYSITEKVFQKALSRRCPSFTPYNTPRSSWAECARVHVARSRGKWFENPHLFNLGKRVEITPTHNTLLPPDFQSLLDGYVFSQRCKMFPGTRLIASVQYLPGNKIKTHNLEVKLGENRAASKTITTPKGVKMNFSALVRNRATIKTSVADSAVVFTSTSEFYKHSTATFVRILFAIKFDSDGTEPDTTFETEYCIGLKFCDCHNNTIFPLASDGEVVIGQFPRSGRDHQACFNFTFYNKEGNSESHDIATYELQFGRVIWFDGVLINLLGGGRDYFFVYFYDIECGIDGINKRGVECRDMWFLFVTQNQRFVISFDKNQKVSRVWDLYKGISHFISEDKRGDITMVGISDGKLMVATYDQKFLRELHESQTLKAEGN